MEKKWSEIAFGFRRKISSLNLQLPFEMEADFTNEFTQLVPCYVPLCFRVQTIASCS